MTDQSTHLKNCIYIFIGPEGAGKSTQAMMLAQSLHLPMISTGDMLRRFAKDDAGVLGTAVRKMFAEHSYLPADLMLQMMKEQLQDSQYQEGAILDGSLRTYEETCRFDEVFANLPLQPSVIVLFLTISQEESIQRLVYGRRRADDIIQSVEARLSHFHERLQERLALIAKKYWLVEIDGMPEKEQVHEEIMEKLNEYGK